MQVYLSKSWKVKLKETENWYSLYVRWKCISSWIPKYKINVNVKKSLDEIEGAYLKWETESEKIENAYKKFHEVIERYYNELINYDDNFENILDYDFNEEVDDFLNNQPINEFEKGIKEIKYKDMLNKEEAEEFFKKLINKWLKLKKEWKLQIKVYEELLNYYNKRRYSLLNNDLYIWIIWIKEIIFFRAKNSDEIKFIYSILFDEN